MGFTVANDVSARDWQMRRNGRQWLLGKTFDTFCPLGPAIVTREAVAGGTGMEWAQNRDGTVMGTGRRWDENTTGTTQGWDGDSFWCHQSPMFPMFFPKVGTQWHCAYVPTCHLPQTSTTCGSAAASMGTGCRTATPATSSLGCPPLLPGCPGRNGVGGGWGLPKLRGPWLTPHVPPGL